MKTYIVKVFWIELESVVVVLANNLRIDNYHQRSSFTT